MQIDLAKLTVKEARDHMRAGDFSCVELVELYLDVAKNKNGDINAYIEIYDDVLEKAKEADGRIKNGESGELLGIPLAMKDNILVKGKKASASSRILENYTAVYDATVTEKLKNAGAVFLGRTNMDEFAMGSSTESSYYGPTKNPIDTDRVPGGSSGGSAAALAMNGALASLGSDTGGSIRQPASFCGLVGLKPTYGAVSRFGLMAMASSLDQIGPIGKSVEDTEILFKVIKGYDHMDSTSSKKADEDVLEDKKQLTIGVPANLLEMPGIDKDVLENFNHSIESLKKAGFGIKEIKLEYAKYSLPAYYIIMPAEVSSNLARFDGVKYGFLKEGENLLEDYLQTRGEGFGKETRRRIMLGTYVLSAGYYDAYYNKANAVRSLIIEDFNKAFKGVDLIATPTTPTPAFKIGEKSKDPLAMYLSDIFTAPANIAGIPSISIPSGVAERDGKNLPLGLQLMATHFREDLLFGVGKAFEKI